jgi:tRNA G10  N-methylase Trm11
MFKLLPFEKELVDLKNYEMVYKIIDNDTDNELYFGNVVASTRPDDYRDDTFHSKYSLKKRPYLGPTSCDTELAFLMANQA